MPRKKKEQGYLMEIRRAKDLREKSPTTAIKILESVVLESQRKKDQRTTGEAFFLLGEIFENIDQKELAIQRYNQALGAINSKKDPNRSAGIHQRVGQLQVALKNAKAAQSSFKICLEMTDDKKLIIKCQEGLADVQLLNKNPDASLKLMDSVVLNYPMDSLENARVEARRSQSFLQQNNYTKASESFYNSIENLPRNQTIDKADYAPIQQAQTDLLSYNELNRADEISLRTNTANLSAPNTSSNDILVRENLKIAELYEKDKNYNEAEKFVAISKKVITPTTDAAAVADVYKMSSELNKRSGRIEAALDDLEAYIAAKEKSIRDLEGDLKEQVEIVKGQKDIDVGQKEVILQEKERELMQSQLRTQQIIIGLLSVLIVALAVFFYFLYKNVKDRRKANQKLLLKSLRTQMNPHFIFNALNSVNNFIAKNDEKAANKYLADFSRLMRKVLDHSQREFIPFEEELELNQLYLKLEHFRFRDKFEYHFDNQLQHDTYDVDIPPMLIQPFIENAVWHGLRYKESKGLT